MKVSLGYRIRLLQQIPNPTQTKPNKNNGRSEAETHPQIKFRAEWDLVVEHCDLQHGIRNIEAFLNVICLCVCSIESSGTRWLPLSAGNSSARTASALHCWQSLQPQNSKNKAKTICVGEVVHTCHGTRGIWRTSWQVRSLLPLCGFRERNSRPQA